MRQFLKGFLLLLILPSLLFIQAASAREIRSTALTKYHFHVELNAQGKKWLQHKEKLRVGIAAPYFSPSHLLVKDNSYLGIDADDTRLIAQQLSLPLKVSHYTSRAEAIRGLERVETDMVSASNLHEAADKSIQSGKADMITAVMNSESRRAVLTFSSRYLDPAYALITRTDPAYPRPLQNLNNKKLALMRGYQLISWLKKNYPKIILAEINSNSEGMQMVAKGIASAAVNTLLSARYMILREYNKQLQVATIIGDKVGELSFGMAKNSAERQSIFNRASQNISLSEMREIKIHGQEKGTVQASDWHKYRLRVLQGFVIAGVLLFLALLWIARLNLSIRQYERIERALNDQMAFMKALVDGTPHPLYVRDRQGLLIHCNTSYLQSLNVTREEASGKFVYELTYTDAATLYACHDDYMRVMEHGQALIQDRVIDFNHSGLKTLYYWISPFSGSDGIVSGIIGGWIDVSERQQLLEHLQAAKNEADAANRAKTTFLTTMSHEIRTPMNAIIGMLDMATRKAKKGDFDREALKVASEAAQGLLDLIGDILDIAHIESGKFTLAPQRASVRLLVESVLRLFDGLARQKRIGLTLSVAGDIHNDVMVDPLRFKQVLSNLISNAIKFTSQGRVDVHVYAEREEQLLTLIINVEDSGIGIPAEELSRLFSSFTQASNNTQAFRSGTGLGLVICKMLCEMMNGTLTLCSKPTAGTRATMRLSLPIAINLPSHSEAAPEELKKQNIALNILVVDDYLPNRLLLSQQISWLGHHVKEAEDGVSGLKIWRRGGVDVIITDCNMPVMNGYQLSETIRREEQEKSLKPVLILGFTANALSGEREHCIAAGMNDCMFKPLSLELLKQHFSAVEMPPDTTLPSLFPDYIINEMDLSNLAQMTRGDANNLKALLGELHNAIVNDIKDLAAIDNASLFSAIAPLAHRIKGGARMMQAERVIICCDNLEAVCKHAHTVMEVAQEKAALEHALECCATALDRYLQ